MSGLSVNLRLTGKKLHLALFSENWNYFPAKSDQRKISQDLQLVWLFVNNELNNEQYAIEKRKKTNIQNIFYKMYRNANIIICAWTYICISWSVSCSLGGLFVFVFMLFVFVFAFAFCWSVSGNYAAGGWPVNHLGVSVSTQQMNPNYSTPKSCMGMATAQRV